MKLKNLLAFAGGIAVGAVAALLLAPTSGAELRGKIIELLKSKDFIKKLSATLDKEKFDDLVALITARVKSFTTVNDLEIIVDEVLAEEGEVQQQAKL